MILLRNTIRTLGPQLVALFMEVREALGVKDLLEDICHWGQSLKVHSFCPVL